MDSPQHFETPFPAKERRSSPRREYAILTHFLGQEVEGHLFSIDLGVGGIRFYSRKELDPERSYEFNLWIEAVHRPIQVKGRIAWQRRLKLSDEIFEVGMMFDDIPHEHKSLLVDYAKGWLKTEEAERRKFLRIPRLLQAEVTEESKELSFSGYVFDLSEDGARLLTSASLEERDAVSLKIELEEGHTVNLSGRIVWARSSGVLSELFPKMEVLYGVKFQVQSVEIQGFINAYLKMRNQFQESALVETLLHLHPGRKP